MHFYFLEDFEPKKISSTNMQENLHQEILRRFRVVKVFPFAESYLRLVTSFLIEYA